MLAIPVRVQLGVVDDCSTDGTGDLLTRLAGELGFTLVRQSTNQGKGAALRRGFEQVTGDLVVIQDADLEYSPEELPDLTRSSAMGAPTWCTARDSWAGTGCSCSPTTWGTWR